DVLVAKGPIAKGASADEALAVKQVALDKRRRADLPATAVRREAEIAGQVAAVDLSGGEIITTNMFVADTELSGSNSTGIDKGNVAITISVDQAAGVAGLISPGDSINILATAKSEEGSGIGLAGEQPEQTSGFTFEAPAVYAFQDVKVLAVGQSLGEPVAEPAEGEAAPAQEQANSGLITVQLPPEDAAILASVRESSLYLTLNRPDYEPVPVPYAPWVPTLSGVQGVSPYEGNDNDGSGQ
ncbi:MAG TPA: Flp pilus assembly protein CpaB, partial [Microthrixaceae bacterium]|nr:Flp pilus assembly protein CpaB [Microthrixaceae bacterium]